MNKQQIKQLRKKQLRRELYNALLALDAMQDALHTSQNKVTQYDKELTQTYKDFAKAELDLAEYRLSNKNIDTLKSELRKCDSELREEKKKHGEAQVLSARQNALVASYENTIKQQAETIRDIESNAWLVDKLSNINTELTSRNIELNEKLLGKESELSKVQSDFFEYKQHYAKLESELAKAMGAPLSEIEMARANIDAMSKRNADLQTEMRTYTAEIERLKRQLANALNNTDSSKYSFEQQ